MNQQPKAVVIGAGIGGLASAIRLAVQGMDVTVFEKNAYPGGKLSHFEQDGYQFDAGPSLFTQPQHIEALFQLADEPIEDYFSYTRVPISCEYFYEDGTRIHAYADREAFSGELTTKLGESENALASYLNRSEKIYQHIGKIFLTHSLHKWKTFVKSPVWDAIKTLRWPYLFHTLHQVNAGHFTNEKTVQLFNRYATYNGSNPYRAPG
ncbi:MAG: NAD(P)-binding protein, partial [Bacteroidota bacterium]|nr:NAD(P)-binding protein [Bacteroidota bacterium]